MMLNRVSTQTPRLPQFSGSCSLKSWCPMMAYMYTMMLMSIITWNTLGIERTRAATIRRSSRIVEIRRSARRRRARRAAMANPPVAGISANTITEKSNTFQPSRKYLSMRGACASIFKRASTMNMPSAIQLPRCIQSPYLSFSAGEVSMPSSIALIMMTAMMAYSNAGAPVSRSAKRVSLRAPDRTNRRLE